MVSELALILNLLLGPSPGFVHWNLVESIGHVCVVMVGKMEMD